MCRKFAGSPGQRTHSSDLKLVLKKFSFIIKSFAAHLRAAERIVCRFSPTVKGKPASLLSCDIVSQIFDELLCRGGELFYRRVGDAELRVLRRVERQAHDAAAAALGRQAVEQADAESRLDHRDGGVVLAGLAAHFRRDVVAREHLHAVVVVALSGHDDLLTVELTDGKGGAIRQRIVLRQHRHHRVALERDPATPSSGG